MLKQKGKLCLICSLSCLLIFSSGFVFAEKKADKTNSKLPVSTTKDNVTLQKQKDVKVKTPKELITAALKNYPRMHYIFPELNKIMVQDKTGDLEFLGALPELNERTPGHYNVYFVTAEGTAHSGILCYLNTDTKDVYVQRTYYGGIFAAKDYRVIVPPEFSDQGLYQSFDDLMRSVLIQDKKVNKEADLIFAYFSDVKEPSKLNVKVKMEDGIGKHDVGSYVIDLFDRKVVDKKTNKILYDDSAVQKYPEKQITLKNCGMETAAILKKLKYLSENEKYYVTDCRVSEDHFSLNHRTGYFVTIQKDNPKNKATTELVGHFFINSTGTVVMRYQVQWDMYEYIYGRYTPFG